MIVLHLIPMEARVAVLVKDMKSDAEIAKQLDMEPATVDHLIQHICIKAEVPNRDALVAILQRTDVQL